MLPVGVLLPTRNSMALLPRHLETMRNWLDRVEEVVVVDSESTDGTRERLRQELTGANVRFFDHPRGLYQSWNFGIRQIRSRYTYISTVGDEMTREGLLHLAEVAQRFDCDVVISKPDFVDEADRPVQPHRWPIDTIIDMLGIKTPVCLEGLPVHLFAVALCPGAILGSSASNLYRTTCLQQHPFPIEFGTVGDGAWAMVHAHHTRLGITPRKVSFFREHTKSYPAREYAVDTLPLKLLQAAVTPSDSQRGANPIELQRLHEAVGHALNTQNRLEQMRRKPWPWVLNPAAWAARNDRDRAQQAVIDLLRHALHQLQIAGVLPPEVRLATEPMSGGALAN